MEPRDCSTLTAAGIEIIEYFPNHSPKIIEAGQHQPPVDVIELLIKHPKLLAIFAHKGAIGGKIDISLDETQVCSDYIGSWVLSCELLSPNPSTCAYVEDLGWVRKKWRNRKPAPEHEKPLVMLKICIRGQRRQLEFDMRNNNWLKTGLKHAEGLRRAYLTDLVPPIFVLAFALS